jgi:hypothetical protein
MLSLSSRQRYYSAIGLRFHRGIRLLPGVRLNLSKSGFSISVGTHGAPDRRTRPLVGGKATLKELALRMRCSQCGKGVHALRSGASAFAESSGTDALAAGL